MSEGDLRGTCRIWSLQRGVVFKVNPLIQGYPKMRFKDILAPSLNLQIHIRRFDFIGGCYLLAA